MAIKGTASLAFGAFPGGHHASVGVSGLTGIAAGAAVDAWISAIATADHSADEHMLEQIEVFARDVVAGVGFTIHGLNANKLSEPITSSGQGRVLGGRVPPIYGVFTATWVYDNP